jgi:tetrahydromethanopterin S-methyltransferase subunit D
MLGAALVVAFLILVGPLAYFFGVDSRPISKRDRDWWPARPRK